MKRIYICISLLICLLPFALRAEWIQLNHNLAPQTAPVVTLLKDDAASTEIRIDLSGFSVSEFSAEGKLYHSIDLLEDAVTTAVGEPEIPHLARILAIPDQGGISVEVLQTGELHTFRGYHLPPARKSWIEGQPESLYSEKPAVYQSEAVYPAKLVSLDPPAVLRDFRIARVAVYPLRYSPARNEIQVYESIIIRINYGSGPGVNPKTSPRRPIASSFAAIYRSTIFNYQSVLDRLYDGEENGRDVLLCIMNDNYVNSFLPYAEWNHRSGRYVHITKFSDIGANQSNPDIIKNYILDTYNNWEYPPTYVLVVGDDGYFPVKYVQYDYTFVNEDYFVELEGNDYFPEMMIGRFTNQSDYRMQVMIEKFLKYEKTPYTADPAWFKKALVCSNNKYESQVKTKRFTARVMMEDGHFTSVDTLMSDGDPNTGYGCSMNVSDIVNILTQGRSFLNYRGEGWTSGWNASCYTFHTSEVASINNGEKFTFVTSIGCGVAMFDANGGNCFGETWLQLGSLGAPRGACAFIGPTSNTHTTYNNRIDKGIYVGLFREGMDTPGQALLRGKLYMYNVFGDVHWVEYHYRIFCVLGDPSIHIWKDVPQDIQVSHPQTLSIGFTQPEFTVTTANGGSPVEGAEVWLVGDEVYSVGKTDAAGKVKISIQPEALDTLSVTVRGGTVVPYLGDIRLTQSLEHVGPFGTPVTTEISGNSDGLMNPNETFDISFDLKNWGTQTASNVILSLSAVDTELVEMINPGPVTYGSIAPGGSQSSSAFRFYIKPECPVGSTVKLKLHITSSNFVWDYIHGEEVFGCKLFFWKYVVNDQESPAPNFRLDPGETVKLYITVLNDGEDVAPNVRGRISTDNPYISISDSSGYFGTIDPDSARTNTANFFVISASSATQTGYEAEFALQLTTQNGNYPYEVLRSFVIPVGIPSPADPTGPDTYGYYAFSSEDSLFNERPVYNWVEIAGLGTQVPRPSGSSNYTYTVTLPFTFQYYGNNYNHLRISTDGWVAFGSGTQTAATNFILPHNDNINCMVAPFWDDLFASYNEIGKIWYYNDPSSHRFIVEWNKVGHRWDYEDRETFQILLEDPVYYPTNTGDGNIIFQYKELVEVGDNTVGIEDPTQTTGITFLFDDEYDSTANRIIDGSAIKFTTLQPSITALPDDEELPEEIVPEDFRLEQNYPNPFNPATRIDYSLPVVSRVSLQIFNIRGQLVRTLSDNRQAAGYHSVTWDGTNQNGARVASGIYFYRLKAVSENRSNFEQIRKLILLK